MKILFQKLMFLGIVGFTLVSCQPQTKGPQGTVQELQKPEWLKDAVLYEVNIRQYTPEGTLNAFAEHLPRLKDMGIDILWLMPVHPISEKNRKGTLGSYYSVKDYKGINPEFGTPDDFKNLVNQAHDLGMKVIMDWVANHTGWDHPWIEEHPDWYTHDSTGVIISPNPDWSDIADLNFDVQPMRREMIRSMVYWLRESDIDGFRCDVAWGVPQDFWEEARASLDSVKPVYMLAEDEDHRELLEKAFDSNYAWKLHHLMNDVAQGKKTAADIRTYFDSLEAYPAGSFPMQFITNHDENSWAGTIKERMGDAGDAFAVMSFTVPGIPLIYSGQEAGLNKRLRFFEKDTINWSNLSKQDLYASLIQLKTENPALWNGAHGGSIQFLETGKPDQAIAFSREKNNNKVIVVMNLFSQPVVLDVKFGVQQEMIEWFDKKRLVGEKVNIELQPWEYKVYMCK
ncbi:MAG: alpha-amylase family glycosyl hydrolase [Mangrovibacterium sp.]